MTIEYQREWLVFQQLKADLGTVAKEEFEKALEFLVERYNTTIYENRFLVGGVVEILTLALLRSVGIACEACGHLAQRGDIKLSNCDRLISIKAKLTGVGDTQLINKQGAGDRKWDTATLFVVSGTGIVFGAPDQVLPKHVVGGSGDAISITKLGLRLLTEDSEKVLSVSIPYKPSTDAATNSLVASASVANRILEQTEAAMLRELVVNELQE